MFFVHLIKGCDCWLITYLSTAKQMSFIYSIRNIYLRKDNKRITIHKEELEVVEIYSSGSNEEKRSLFKSSHVWCWLMRLRRKILNQRVQSFWKHPVLRTSYFFRHFKKSATATLCGMIYCLEFFNDEYGFFSVFLWISDRYKFGSDWDSNWLEINGHNAFSHAI